MKCLRLLLFFFLSFICLNLYATTDGDKFRFFLFELIQLNNPIGHTGESSFQTIELDHYIKTNELLLNEANWINNIGHNISQETQKKITIDLKMPIEDYLTKNKQIRVAKFNQLLIDNIDLMPSILDKNKFEALLKEGQLHNMYKDMGLSSDLLETLKDQIRNKFRFIKSELNIINNLNIENIVSIIKAMPKEDTLKILSLYGDKGFDRFNSKLNQSLSDLDFSLTSDIKELKNADFNIPNENMKRLADKVVVDYFNQDMPSYMKREIIAQIFKLKSQDHNRMLEGIVLSNTGVEFQKSMQFFISKSSNEKLKELGEKLKSGLNHLSEIDLQYVLDNYIDPNLARLIKNPKQVAAATTGVGVLAEFEGEKIFLKMLRPGLKQSVQRDAERILNIVGDDVASRTIVDSITQGILEEIDLTGEARNFDLAREVYVGQGIEVPRVIHKIKPNANVMAMSVAKGVNVSKLKLHELSDQDLIKLRDAYEMSYKRWFATSLDLATQKGVDDDKIKDVLRRYNPSEKPDLYEVENYKKLFNGDLHEGNVFIDFNPSNGKSYELTWIDWGNAHKLNLEIEQGQIKLVLGAISRNENAIINAINDVTPLTQVQMDSLRMKVRTFLIDPSTASLSPNLIANRVMGFALQEDVKLPPQMVNWGRGKGFLENTMDNINKELLKRNIPNVKAIDPTRLSGQILTDFLIKEFPQQVIGLTPSSTSPIPTKTLMNFVADHSKYLFSKYCKLLFQVRR